MTPLLPPDLERYTDIFTDRLRTIPLRWVGAMSESGTGTKVPKDLSSALKRNNVPMFQTLPTGRLDAVSMYVEILSSALDDWVADLVGAELVEYAVLCREELLAASPYEVRSPYTALAAEIAYDRALIALCTEHGIEAHATSFMYPSEERARIEGLLAQVGVDLDTTHQGGVTDQEHPPVLVEGEAEMGRHGATGAAQHGISTAGTPGDVANDATSGSVDVGEMSILNAMPGSSRPEGLRLRKL